MDQKVNLRYSYILAIIIWLFAIYLIPHVPNTSKVTQNPDSYESLGQTVFMLLASGFIGAISLAQFFEQNQWVIICSIALTGISIVHFFREQYWLGIGFWVNSGAFVFFCSKSFSLMRFADGLNFYQFLIFILSSPLSPLVLLGIFIYLAIRMGFENLIKSLLRR